MTALAPYEVHAIRYARNPRATTRENFLGGDAHDTPMPLDYFVWAIRGNGRTFILDTGFESEVGQRRQREILRSPGEGLACIGIDPDAVEDVIVSHMHYDHCGNYGLFPRARYNRQDAEMAIESMRSAGFRATSAACVTSWCARAAGRRSWKRQTAARRDPNTFPYLLVGRPSALSWTSWMTSLSCTSSSPSNHVDQRRSRWPASRSR